eukprot:9287407-Pyramimonas_sp.AAC.2
MLSLAMEEVLGGGGSTRRGCCGRGRGRRGPQGPGGGPAHSSRAPAHGATERSGMYATHRNAGLQLIRSG